MPEKSGFFDWNYNFFHLSAQCGPPSINANSIAIANYIQSKSVQNNSTQQQQQITNDDQISKQGSKQTAKTQDVDSIIQSDETLKRSVCYTYKYKLMKINVPNDLRSNYRHWKTPAYKVYSYQKYPIPKKNTHQENQNVNKQLPTEKGTCSITVSQNFQKRCYLGKSHTSVCLNFNFESNFRIRFLNPIFESDFESDF